MDVWANKSNRIRYELIRGTVKVVEASTKAQDERLQWYGHVRRRKSEYVELRTIEMEVTGRRKRGRPRLSWRDRLRVDMD